MTMSHSLKDKRLTLTGAGGFLGRNLLPLLLDEGVMVSAVTSRSRLELCKLAGVDEGNELVSVVPQCDQKRISKALADADYLINAGFPRNTDGRQLAQGMDFIDWLFQEAARKGTHAVVNISSQSVYDQQRAEPATEDMPVCPQSPYAVAKYATELILNNSCRAIPHTNIRLASLVGQGFDQRVVNKMARKALSEGQIIASDLTGVFGYLDVLDAARGLMELLEASPRDWHEVINIGVKHGYTTEDMANLIKVELSKRGIPIEVVSQDMNNSTINTTVDSRVFHGITGWKPSETLPKTIRRIVDSFFPIEV